MFRFIKTADTGVKQTFGKFTGLCEPGLNFYIPGIQQITPVSNKVIEKVFILSVKTKDNVFTDLHLSIQLQIKAEDTKKAYFSLGDPRDQIASYVQNVVRSHTPKMTLDELFESQSDISNSVSEHLQSKMSDYGYTILDTLINDIVPAHIVSDSMNQINASERLKVAAKNEAEIMHLIAQEKDHEKKMDELYKIVETPNLLKDEVILTLSRIYDSLKYQSNKIIANLALQDPIYGSKHQNRGIVGGSIHYHKYLKYKNKYLQLKNK